MKAKKIISVILTGIVAASMLAGCGSSSRSQTDNTESSSQNEASSSSASETADATEDSENTETTESTDTSENTETPTPAETDDSSETAVADDTESTGKTLVLIRNLQEKLWLYIILQQELLKELHRQSQIQQAVIYLKSSRWNLIQMMIWTGQMMIVVYPENMMMKV